LGPSLGKGTTFTAKSISKDENMVVVVAAAAIIVVVLQKHLDMSSFSKLIERQTDH
jgi:N12 class adenine-specific DNA methylase